MKYLNRVMEVSWLGGYRIKAVFADGYGAEIDLSPLVKFPRGPMEEPLSNEAFFKKVFLDGGSVAWPNTYDICPDVLRYWCEIGHVCSQEELDAAFSEQTPTEAMVLNDKKIS